MLSSRRIELDGLRGLAITLVLIYHYFYRFDQLFIGEDNAFWLFDYFKHGVTVFFILSGYLIYDSVVKNKKFYVFLIHRFFRIYPAYWVGVTYTFVVLYFWPLDGRSVGFVDYFFNLTMLQKYFGYPNVDGVYWTLFVEVRFYLLVAVFLLFGIGRWLVFVLLGMSFVFVVHDLGFISLPKVLGNLFLADYLKYFSFGVLASVCISFHKRFLWFLYSLLFALLILTGFSEGWDYFLFSLVSVLCLLRLVPEWVISFLSSRFLVFMGGVSYSLYLVHQNVGYLIIKYFFDFGERFFGALIAVLVSLLVSFFINKYIEYFGIALSRKIAN